MTALTAQPAPAITYDQLTTTARAWRDSVEWACLNMRRALAAGNGKRATAAEWSEKLLSERGLRMSADRLRHIYGRWNKRGEAALINGRLLGRVPERRLLPQAVVAQFWGVFLKMNDKASKGAAWRVIMQKLCSGEELNGGLTWQGLWLRLHPSADLPAACPWNHHNPPAGWSLSSFTATACPSALVEALANKGMGAARAIVARDAGVRMDWASLRIGECYMIDDHDVDFLCLVNGQLVELRLVVLIEVRSRRVLAYVVRPRLKDEDGTKRSITHRDVMHLLAGWLHKYGVPRDYPSVLHMENAAATVSSTMTEVLARVTGGRLSVDKTPLYSGVVKMASFRQHGGTPTGKAPIESKFRTLDIELALVRGAKGRNYIHKPEELTGRLQATRTLIDRARELPDIARSDLAQLTLEGKVKFPFASLREAHEEIGAAIARMDARTWHEMEGFLQVKEFRTSPDSRIFYPLAPEHFEMISGEAQEVVKEFFTYPPSLQKRMADEWGRTRAETSAECWLRLSRGVPWLSISQASVFDLLMDAQPVEYRGHGVIRLNISGTAHEYRGRLEALAGDRLVCRYNADAPESIWVQDRAGRLLGTMNRVERIGFHDAETLRERAEFKAVTLAHAVQQVRMYEANDPDALREIQDREDLAALMDAFDDDHARPRPVATMVNDSSNDLAAAAEGRRLGDAQRRDSAADFLKNL